MKKSDYNTYISQSGYIIRKNILTSSQINNIKENLKVKPFHHIVYANNQFNMQAQPFILYLETPNKFYLPRFWAINTFGQPQINLLKNNPHAVSNNILFKGTLNEQQDKIIDIFMPHLLQHEGGILNLRCGIGKTVLALYIICQLKQKALIIVHKSFLMDQWIDRIKQFIPNARIGIIRQDTVIIDECDIVLGMIQSISIRYYPKQTFMNFGITIIDECHHAAAEMFSKALQKISSQYMIGLSATLERKDGLRCVFEWFLGIPVVSICNYDKQNVNVNIYNYYEEDENFKQVKYTKTNKTVQYSSIIDNIINSDKRNLLIINNVRKCIQQSRIILIITERRSHLEYLYNNILLIHNKVGKYMGGMKKEDLKKSEDNDIIIGTYNMISEGFDLPKLNTLIFATPKADIEQSVGRILRSSSKSKHDPLIIDINDISQKQLSNRSQKRKKYYKKNSFIITQYK